MSDQDRKCILISGGSRGLGLAMVARYLDWGHAVATFARQLSPALKQLLSHHTDTLFFRAMDAAQPDLIDDYMDEAISRLGPIYGLVNNAAAGQDHLLANMSCATIAHLLTVNLHAPIVLTRSVVRRMLTQGLPGRIVSITSICGSRGYAALSVYSATKGGMDAFTRSLARELGARDILVNAIAPGFFESAMSSPLSSEQLDTIQRRTPSGRLTAEQDVLQLLDLLLFSNVNITGQTIYVDGGATL